MPRVLHLPTVCMGVERLEELYKLCIYAFTGRRRQGRKTSWWDCLLFPILTFSFSLPLYTNIPTIIMRVLGRKRGIEREIGSGSTFSHSWIYMTHEIWAQREKKKWDAKGWVWWKEKTTSLAKVSPEGLERILILGCTVAVVVKPLTLVCCLPGGGVLLIFDSKEKELIVLPDK